MEKNPRQRCLSITRNDLTIRQRRFVTAYVEGKPIVRAAKDAGYAPSTAARGATELLRSPQVRSAIQKALEAAGVTDERLARIISQGLEASKVINVTDNERMSSVAVADWSTRHRFVDTSLRLKGAYPDGDEGERITMTWEQRLTMTRQAKDESPGYLTAELLEEVNDDRG